MGTTSTHSTAANTTTTTNTRSAPEAAPAAAIPAAPAPSAPPRPRRHATWRGGPPLSSAASPWRTAPAELDLRRARDRAVVDTILDRAAILEPPERWLLEAVYRDSRTIRDIAEELGEHPRRVAQQVRRLVARVLSEPFAFVASRRDGWEIARRRIATLVVLKGRSLREAADELRVSLHTVRRHMAAVNAAAEALAVERRAARKRMAEQLARADLGD